MEHPHFHIRRLIFGAIGVLILLHGLHTVFGVGPERLINGWVYSAIEFTAAGLCIWRVIAVAEERAAWTMIAAWVSLWVISDLGWTIWLDDDEQIAYPNLTDAGYLTSYGFAITGLVLLLRSRMRSAHVSLLLDGLVAGLSIVAVGAALVWEPITASATGSDLAVATTLSYPLLDFGLLCVVGVAFGAVSWRPGRTWGLLGASLLVIALADGLFSYMESTGDGIPAVWVNTLWPVAITLAAAAAWQPRRVQSVQRLDLSQMVVPMVFGLFALAVLVYGVWDAERVPTVAALFAAIALVVAGARGAFTFNENVALLRRSRLEALTDNLTGLANRRALMSELDRRLSEPGGANPFTLVFFDLDGFKGYNDVFGHTAGDELLKRLGGRLSRSVVGRGMAFRPGGDEFCAMFEGQLGPADDFVISSVSALAESGEGFDVAASFGLVVLPTEADTPTRALTIVDERMYADKGKRRSSTRPQARDLLIGLLRARQQGPGSIGDVESLARGVCALLEIDRVKSDEIATAAELHDLGKVSIPESILRKAGPLDDSEWNLMRQHTIVGERIMAAAPALEGPARIVRSSHEWWDGTGYPDGLTGEAIPLGARIIAVCDAFDAMVSPRPYAMRKPRTAAIAELQRCSGTQFDPMVVDAFVTMMDRPAERRSKRGAAA